MASSKIRRESVGVSSPTIKAFVSPRRTPVNNATSLTPILCQLKPQRELIDSINEPTEGFTPLEEKKISVNGLSSSKLAL